MTGHSGFAGRVVGLFALLAGALSAAELTPYRADAVSWEGAFTPDGTSFVYALMPAGEPPVSRIMAMSLADGSTRSLGEIPLDAHKIPTDPIDPFDANMSGATTVSAVTDDLELVFVSQDLLVDAGESHRAWDSVLRDLVPQDFRCHQARYLGPLGDQRDMMFADWWRDVPAYRITAFDQADRSMQSITVPLSEDYRYSQEIVNTGSRVLGLITERYDRPERVLREHWPVQRLLAELPPRTVPITNMRTGPGAKMDSVTWSCALVGATPAGELVIQRGDEVLAADADVSLPLRTVRPLADENPVYFRNVKVACDTTDARVYSGFLDITMPDGIDADDYLPDIEILEAKRDVHLSLRIDQLGSPEPASQELRFDCSSAFARMAALALENSIKEAEEQSGNREVLTRQPEIETMVARDGLVTVMLKFHVHYGISGRTYFMPVMVDTRHKELRASAECFTYQTSGMSFGRQSCWWCFSPRGDAVAVIADNELYLYTWTGRDR